MNNQCHMLTCRYNHKAECIRDPEYKICREDKLIKTEFYRKKKGVFYDVSSKL